MSCNDRLDGQAEERLERQIGAALHERADKLEVPAASDQRLFRKLADAQPRPSFFSRGVRRYGRGIMLTMCMLVCLSCATTLATANGTGTGAGGGWVTASVMPFIGEFACDDYAEVEKLVELLGYEPEYRESLAGDWDFVSAHIDFSQRLDENNEYMSHVYKELYIRYRQRSSGEALCFVANDFSKYIDTNRGSMVRRQIDGVTVVYKEQPYKFVPVDYELTAEDQQALAEGSLEISCGSSELEETLNQAVEWVQDDVRYLVFGWDLEIGEEEMFEIAREFISGGGNEAD